MSKQLLKTLVVTAVLLSLAAVPAMAQTQNGPLVATRQATGEIDKIDSTTGELTTIPGAIVDRGLRSAPSLTPDGNTVVYVGEVGGNTELFSIPIDGSAAPIQITSTVSEPNSSFKRDPVVSPDGQTVYFNWDRYDSDFTNFQGGLYSVPIGGGEPTSIVEDSEDAALRIGMKLTPSGQYLVYITEDPETFERKKVEAIPVNGGPTHTVVDYSQVAGFAAFGQLDISPDGITLVISGEERKGAGSTSLYTAPFSPTTTTTRATILSGTKVRPLDNSRTGERNRLVSPAFSPDGKSIAYNLHSVPRELGFVVEEIRSVPATGWTPTVIVPRGNDSTFLHENLIWAPQVATSVVPEVDAEQDNGT